MRAKNAAQTSLFCSASVTRSIAAAIDRVTEAEQNSDVCAAFFALIEDDHPHIYEALKTYE